MGKEKCQEKEKVALVVDLGHGLVKTRVKVGLIAKLVNLVVESLNQVQKDPIHIADRLWHNVNQRLQNQQLKERHLRKKFI
jgi:hypothetical protein